MSRSCVRRAASRLPQALLNTGYSYYPITFTSTYGGMGRPSSLTDNSGSFGSGFWPNPAGNTTWAQNVSYDVAGRMTSMQRFWGTTTWDCTGDDVTNTNLTEAMTYNVNGQLLTKNFGSVQYNCGTVSSQNNGLQYAYTTSTRNNNGQITQAVDTISGETINYTYDALKRLTEAISTPRSGSPVAAWTQQFQYDGFGNLTAKIQTGVTNPVPAVNPTNNQFTGSSYDLNGNMISGVGATLGYDEANRLSSVSPTSGGTGYYGYAPDNKRIYQALPSRYGVQEAWTFYGAHGEKLGVYQWFDVRGDGTCTGGCALRPQTWNVWFGGKMIYEGGSSVYEVGTAAGATYHDRVGTNRANGARFYPYGDQISGIASDHEMFATYQRDGFTGLDYADQRYYASSYGKFNTADQYMASAGPSDPGSWNRYAYVGGDPVNFNDPRGRESCSVDAEGNVGCDGQSKCDLIPTPACVGGPGSNGQGDDTWGNTGGNTAPGTQGTSSYFLALNRAKAAQSGVQKLKDKQPCDDVLDTFHMTFQDLQSAVGNEVFADGTQSSVTMVSLFGNSSQTNQTLAAAQYGNQTVQSYLAGQGSGAAAIACAGCSSVFLNFNNFGGGVLMDSEAVLMHEALHNVTGLSDLQLQKALSGFGLKAGDSSNNITNLIATKCF